MAFDFPASPTVGQTFTPSGGPTYTWNGYGWTLPGSASGVSSWNTRTGAVTMTLADVTGVGGAPLASPVFTGDPQAPTPATADNDTSVATTAFVKAQGYVTGGPYQPLDADLTTLAALGNWKVVYSDGSSAIQALSIGASGSVLTSNGTAAAPSWQTPAGGGNVSSTGTPANGQWAQWTDATHIQGVALASTPFGKTPQVTVFTSGSGTYTVPAGALWLEVEMVGGGGSGAGNSAGNAGGNTTFGSSLFQANGGGGGATGGGIANGGAASGGSLNMMGGAGPSGTLSLASQFASVGGMGGSSFFGGAGAAGYNTAGTNAGANTGSGGGGGASDSTTTTVGGGGGASGGYCYGVITSPAASYPYAVGAGGAAVVTGGAFKASGAGAAGVIIVKAYFAG